MEQQQLMDDWRRATGVLKEQPATPALDDTAVEETLLLARLDSPTAEKKKKCNSALSYV